MGRGNSNLGEQLEMTIYHVLNHIIGGITFIYASLAVARMRPARRKRR